MMPRTTEAPPLPRPGAPRVLLLTGTCGSGKSTIAERLGARPGWAHVSEDAIWASCIGRDRGAPGTPEHRAKRRLVHAIAFAAIRAGIACRGRVVVDATVHEAPPESYEEYRAFFRREEIPWALRVLHPELDVAVARDAARDGSHAGRTRVESLWTNFAARAFPAAWYLDTSRDTPEETVRRLVDCGLA